MTTMTLDEANAVNTVCGYLAGDIDLPDEVVGALETLASGAHDCLQAGWDVQAVRNEWPSDLVA